MHQKRKRSSLPLALGLVVFIALIGFSLAHTQTLSDWLRLRNYHPSATVTQLADQTTMTPAARHLFYLNHPAIDTKAAFAKACPGNTEKTIILGCYHDHEAGIFVLQVSDARLQGVEQVTAAHETLHAAYERLNAHDKAYVDGLLEDYFQHDLKDQRIKDTLKAYETSEPGQQINEMHSIFGTEIANLPAPLEAYYKRYFTNRAQIAAYAASYQAAFTSREATIAKDDTQLSIWQKSINADEASLNSQDNEITDEQNQLQAYKDENDVSAYNSAIPSFNTTVDVYNNLLAQTKELIAQYNNLVEARNAIATEETQLEQAITGSLAPVSQ